MLFFVFITQRFYLSGLCIDHIQALAAFFAQFPNHTFFFAYFLLKKLIFVFYTKRLNLSGLRIDHVQALAAFFAQFADHTLLFYYFPLKKLIAPFSGLGQMGIRSTDVISTKKWFY